jgi:O-antigen ligase
MPSFFFDYKRKLRTASWSKAAVIQIAFGLGFGLIFVLAIQKVSPLIVFGILIAILFSYVSFRRPEIALLGILIATSSIIFEDNLPLISLGGLSLHIPDIILLSLFGFIVLRWLTGSGYKIVRTPLDWPLLIFFTVTVISTVLAIMSSTVESEDGRRWLRIMAYYLTFFVVTNLIKNQRQITLLLNGVFIMATGIAVAMVLQYVLGNSVNLIPGRVESLITQNSIYSDVTRILPPGWSIVLLSLITIFCVSIVGGKRKFTILTTIQCALMALALILTFLRSYWAAIIFVWLILGIIIREKERKKFFTWVAMATASGAVILLIAALDTNSRMATLIGASTERLGTIGSSGTYAGQDGPLNWRKIENEYALAAILDHPLIGLGMGARYRPWDPRLDQRGAQMTGYDFRKHIHNGYFWVMLDMGALGFVSLMWLSVAFLWRGFRNWRKIVDEKMRAVMLGFCLVYVAVLIASVANSPFVQWRWTPVIGIMMGLNEVILRNYKRNEAS